MKNYPQPAQHPPLVAIVGPTSSGKSELAVKLAKRFNGEIISADSRQIYRGMDLGTGKVPGKWTRTLFNGRQRVSHYLYKNIVHHLIDFANPKTQYSAARFQKQAQKIIIDILKRGKLPILCGGTAQWIDAVAYNQSIPEVKPNTKLRRQLEQKSTAALYRRLLKLDPVRAAAIDPKNPRRLIRALEIVLATGRPVPARTAQSALYNCLFIGISQPQPILYQKIKKRLLARLGAGMLKEIKKLRRQGVSWQRLESFGLEYKFGARFLQKKITYDEMFGQLLLAIQHYTKRQMTWWKRNQEIHWVKNETEAKKLIEKIL